MQKGRGEMDEQRATHNRSQAETITALRARLAAVEQENEALRAGSRERFLQEQAQRLVILHRIGNDILAGRPLEAIAHTVLGYVRGLIPYRRASLVTLDLRVGEARLVAVQDAEGEHHHRPGPRLSLHVFAHLDEIRAGNVRMVEDLQALPAPSKMERLLRKEGVRAYLCVPLIAEGALLGLLNVGRARPGRFAEDEVDVLRQIADQVALALWHSRLRRQVQQQTEELEQRVAERTAELQQERNFVSTVLDTAGALVAVFDQRGRLIHLNQTCEQLAGYTAVEIGHIDDWERCLPPADLVSFQKAFSHLRAGLSPKEYETDLVAKDGHRFRIAWSGTTLADKRGRVHYVITVGLDISERREAEKAMQRLAAIVESSQDAIIGKSLAGIIQSWNRGAEKIYGYTEAEALGEHISLLVPPERRQEVERLLERLRQGERIAPFETVRRTKDGRLIDISLALSPLLDAPGRVVGASTIARDISKRKQVERALRASEAFNQAVLDSLVVHVGVLDEQGRLVAVNEAWQAFAEQYGGNYLACTGVETHDLQVCRCAVHEGDGTAEEVLAGIREVLSGHRAHFSKEYACHLAEGPRWFLMDVTPLQDGRGGAIVAHMDVTERRQAQIAREESRARLDGIITTATDGIITIDEDQRIVLFNSAAERIFQYEADDVLGRPLDVLMPPRYRAVHREHVCRFGQSEATTRSLQTPGEIYGLRADGTEFPLEATVSKVAVGGQQLFTVILRDITQRKRIEAEKAQLFAEVTAQRAQLRKLTQQVVFAQEEERQRVSRELHDEAGQALTVLKYSLELMLADLPGTTGDLEGLRRFRQHLREALNLCEQTMSQIRTISHDLRPSALDDLGLNLALEAFCHDFANRTSLTIDYKGVETPRLANAVDISLYRFLQEALTNVARHARAHRVWVRLQRENGTIHLTVQDDGRGFDAPAGEGAQQTQAGEGIGLLGMKERLESVGGRLEIDSAPGRGARLVAHVPIQDENA